MNLTYADLRKLQEEMFGGCVPQYNADLIRKT